MLLLCEYHHVSNRLSQWTAKDISKSDVPGHLSGFYASELATYHSCLNHSYKLPELVYQICSAKNQDLRCHSAYKSKIIAGLLSDYAFIDSLTIILEVHEFVNANFTCCILLAGLSSVCTASEWTFTSCDGGRWVADGMWLMAGCWFCCCWGGWAIEAGADGGCWSPGLGTCLLRWRQYSHLTNMNVSPVYVLSTHAY